MRCKLIESERALRNSASSNKSDDLNVGFSILRSTLYYFFQASLSEARARVDKVSVDKAAAEKTASALRTELVEITADLRQAQLKVSEGSDGLLYHVVVVRMGEGDIDRAGDVEHVQDST